MQHSSADDAGETLFWPAERWQALQAEHLHKHVRWCAQRSELYRGRNLEQIIAGPCGKNADAILQSLPLTTKDNLAAAGAAAFGIAPAEVREWVCTSGTLGRPLDVPLSAGDLQRLAENEAAALSLAGVAQGDILALAVGMDRMFVAGLAYWLGGQRLGATCVRVGPGVGMLNDVCRRLGKGRRIFLIAVPSFLLNLESLDSRSAKPGAHIDLAAIIAIGEPVRASAADYPPNTLAQKLHQQFRCPTLSTYATTETCTTFAEAPACIGGHLNPKLAALEILNEHGKPLADGEVGEVVVTPLGVEGLPLLRFRTGDMAAMLTTPCPCGRTTPRIGPIVGRKQQLLKIKGTSVYPGAIAEALRAINNTNPCVVVAERDDLGGDRATVYIVSHDDPAMIERKLSTVLRVRIDVRLVNREELSRLTGNDRKPRQFVDRRT